MKIKLNYVLPLEDFLTFSHLGSNVLTVVVDTSLCDSIRDVKARIVDEVLRKYQICVTRFDESKVHNWEKVLHAALSDIGARTRRIDEKERLRQDWMAAVKHAKNLGKLRDSLVSDADALVKEAYRTAEAKRMLYMEA